ncbi:MAG: hypothetical protein EOP24_34325 [Hyphomicrobiales bacterium]|nr:MAG: hypothetical protein EOP24_34325 [Hyphomicrobiales bacterium]
MSRPAAFTQGDVAKVLKGAKAAGLSVASIEIDRSGKIVARFGRVAETEAASGNEWDEVLANGQGERTAA